MVEPGAAALKRTPLVAAVYAQLADGEFHSGQQLARRLHVTRSAVWKAVGQLRKLDVPLQAVRNRGYQLERGSEPLSVAHIRQALPQKLLHSLTSLEVEWSIDSTNSALAARVSCTPGSWQALLAEYQSAGRGRRGRRWLAPPGGAICMSFSWTFAQMPRDAGALSLAMGVCVLRALRSFDLAHVRLKWPNDILIDERKLGGILIELRAEAAGPANVIVGIGLNVTLGAALIAAIAQLGLPAIDLASQGVTASRNALAAAVLEHCIEGLARFEQEGLGSFIEEWREADALRGRLIDVHGSAQPAAGLARGIDIGGALLVETPQGVKRFYSGDVTVRAQQ